MTDNKGFGRESSQLTFRVLCDVHATCAVCFLFLFFVERELGVGGRVG